jgi:hypothetical protein
VRKAKKKAHTKRVQDGEWNEGIFEMMLIELKSMVQFRSIELIGSSTVRQKIADN